MSYTMDFSHTCAEILRLTDEWEKRLGALPEQTISVPRNGQRRNIRQITGHLIDSASNNHQRIVRLQYNTRLEFPDYRQDNDLWIALQDYEHEDWQSLVSLWKFYNIHMVHIIGHVDFTRFGNIWTDFEGTEVSLAEMIDGYLDHLNLHLNEIEELINQK